MKDNLANCLKDFAGRIKGNYSFRRTIARVLDIGPRTPEYWFDKMHLPNGVNLLKLQLLLEVNGYRVQEFQKLDPAIRKVGKIVATGLITTEEAAKDVGFKRAKDIARLLIGGSGTSSAKMAEINVLAESFTQALISKLEEWKEEVVLKEESATLPASQAKETAVSRPVQRTSAIAVEQRIEAVRYLLLALETELRHFRDGERAERDAFRKLLNPQDMGYISSLLGMLGDEERFQRWLQMSTYKFQRFQRS
jgi:hypothetical protein